MRIVNCTNAFDDFLPGCNATMYVGKRNSCTHLKIIYKGKTFVDTLYHRAWSRLTQKAKIKVFVDFANDIKRLAK